MPKEKWEAPPAGPEGDQTAKYRMSEAEKKLSNEYEIAAQRMGEMKITGNVDLIWNGRPHEKPILEGMINGMSVRIEGASSAMPSQVLRVPAAFPTSEYSGTIDGVQISSEDAQYMFGKLMGVAISRSERDTARRGAALERVGHLIRKVRLSPEDEYPYPGEADPEYKRKK